MSVRKIIGRGLLAIALVISLLLVAYIIAAALRISIDAAPWRQALAAKASELIGRQVTLEGPLRLTIALPPEMTVSGMAVANPSGFSSPQLVRLDRAHMRVKLLPLLRREISVLAMHAEDVHVRLEETADGRVNWNLALPARTAAAQSQPSSGEPARLEELDLFTLKRINVEFVSGGTTHAFALDELEARGARGKPVEITLKGRVENTFPYTMRLHGNSLAELYRPDKPWPLQIQLKFAGTALHVEGSLTNPMTNPAADLVFGIGTQDLSELERLSGWHFPPVGVTGLSGRVIWAGTRLAITELNGIMGRTILEGELAFDLVGAKPRVKGRLRMPVLDLRPFVDTDTAATQTVTEGDTVSELRKDYSQIERQTLKRRIAAYDGDLLLQVDRWIGVVGEVRDSELRISLHDGKLQAPVHTVVADVPLSGELNMDAHKPTPEFSLWLGTQNSKLGRLAQVFAGMPGVQGEFGRFRLALQGQGNSPREIVYSLALTFELKQARLSYGHIEGGKPVELRVDACEIAIPAAGKLSGTLRGSLLGTPLQARFTGGDLPTLTRETRWPLQLEASATGARLRLSGVLAAPEAQSGTDFTFDLTAKRASDVAGWLGLSRDAAAPIFVSGHARVESDEWHMDRIVVRLGKTAMHAAVARTGIGKQPLVQARVVVEHLEVPELEAMLPPPDPNAKTRGAIDLPILPHGIALADSDVNVQLKHVQLRRAAITDVAFNGRIRGGLMWPSPFSMKVAGTPFLGAIRVDLRGTIPEASVWVVAEKVNLGELLERLGVVESLDASAHLVRAALIGRGSRLGEMLQRSSLLAELELGALTLRERNGKWKVPIRLAKGVARAAPGEQVRVDLDGAIETTPVSIHITSGTLPDFVGASRVPFALLVDTSGTHLELAGSAALPLTQHEAQLELTARGARFDSLNQLARVQFPPWGPWEVKGTFRASKTGYEMPDMRLQIGDSSLSGHGSLKTLGTRPRIDLDLNAQRIQLNDFPLAHFSFHDKTDKPSTAQSLEEMRVKARQAAVESQKLLSPEFMRKLDGSVVVNVARVLSGKDQLGSGSLNAQLTDGRFSLDPAKVTMPGGSARISVVYEPTERDVQIGANVLVDRFDYGVLARRLNPDVNMQGLFSVNMEIKSRVPTLDKIMHHADGRIEFTVWPRDLGAGIFDLWAVSLFLALLPTIDPGSQSTVNCVVGRFNLRDGKLSPKTLIIDTRRVRVTGQGQVDFQADRMGFRLEPRAKEPQFFSLSTPVTVDGTLTNFHIRASGSDVLGTVVRLFTSWIVVPLEKLSGRGVPRDGQDVCGNSHAVASQ